MIRTKAIRSQPGRNFLIQRPKYRVIIVAVLCDIGKGIFAGGGKNLKLCLPAILTGVDSLAVTEVTGDDCNSALIHWCPVAGSVSES